MKRQKDNLGTITLYELWIGTVFWNLVILAVGIWLVKDKFTFVMGLALGCVTAMVIAGHMASSISKMLSSNVNVPPKKGLPISSLIRYGIVALVLIVACFSPYADPIATFIGIISLKLSAYINPLIGRITGKVLGWSHEPSPEAIEGGELQREEEEKARMERESEQNNS
ncbi:MAG: ATP synthase subunit I [Lachnospiraceae bacterium]|nr:ATP synthase subunit I [Lachnospiraceae bacterium]